MKAICSILFLTGFLSAFGADTAFESAFRTSLLKSFDEATGKIIALADAIPEDKYGWRPMEGVASVREVLVHVAETHYALGERLGRKPPAGIDGKGIGKTMVTKAGTVATTKASMGFIRGVLAEIPPGELLPEVNVFGSKAPRLRVALLPLDHAHEHLGQLIAYARIDHIVPPWSK